MPDDERYRRIIAYIGLALWSAYPFLYLLGIKVAHDYRCAGRAYRGHFDDCFNDILPFEILVIPFTLALTIPFLRLASSLFAPPPERRTARWRLATRSAAGAYFPAFQIAAAAGVAWAVWHVSALPRAWALFPLFLYWLAWICWFCLGAWAARPLAKQADA